MKRLALLSILLVAAACGPAARGGSDDTPGDDMGDDGGPPDANPCTPSEATETACNDGFDTDCDTLVDCSDVDCAGLDGCPDPNAACEVSTPSASLSLPDGACTGSAPDPGAPDAEMEAFLSTCGAYEATLNLTGFPAGATLTDTTKLLGICVTMEHSWLRDLQMEAYCPDGNRVLLSKFAGQDCPSGPCEVFLGEPYEDDEFSTPVPGVGYDYCWTSTATNPSMITYSNAQPDVFPYTLPAGDYQPSDPYTNFMGCQLNGAWRIRVVDGWGIDNGYIFESRLLFDGSLSGDCPVIE